MSFSSFPRTNLEAGGRYGPVKILGSADRYFLVQRDNMEMPTVSAKILLDGGEYNAADRSHTVI